MLCSAAPWQQLLEHLWPSCCPLCHGNPLAVTMWHTGDRGAQGIADVCVRCWNRYTSGNTRRALIAIGGSSSLGRLLDLDPVMECIAAFAAADGSWRMRRPGIRFSCATCSSRRVLPPCQARWLRRYPCSTAASSVLSVSPLTQTWNFPVSRVAQAEVLRLWIHRQICCIDGLSGYVI